MVSTATFTENAGENTYFGIHLALKPRDVLVLNIRLEA